MIRTIRRSTAVLAVLVAAAACNNDEISRPFLNTPVDPLFDRYVSMGNSITAGFQSGGINDSTQQQSYAVLLAHAMRSPFFVPSRSEERRVGKAGRGGRGREDARGGQG